MPYIKVVQVSGGANECGATYQPAVIDGRIDAPKNVDRPICYGYVGGSEAAKIKQTNLLTPSPP